MIRHSALYVGEVMHRRTRPRRHHLRYRLFSLLVDLDELPELDARLRLFSHNRFNLFALHDRDHGDRSPAPIRPRIEAMLRAHGFDFPSGPIRLLTMPRILGYAFNPLSLFFCHDRLGRLRAIAYEVSNTFGERHTYLLAVDPARPEVRQHSAKAFHVSPFLPMAMRYAFRVRPPSDAPGQEALMVAISAADAQGEVLAAVQTARRRRLSDRMLARLFVTHPLLTAKVSAAILWEALHLWRRRIPLHPHPLARAGRRVDGQMGVTACI